MNRTTKINILAYASEPDKNYKYEGDIVDYKGKRYFVSLAEERVEFIGIIKVIWIIVIGLCVFGFYYIDNEWLEN